MGFENVRPSRFTNSALTTIAHPMEELAQRACELLEQDDISQEYLSPFLVVHESTAAPRE